MRLFLRTDNQTITNAIKMSLPVFKEEYRGVTSDKILEEAYFSIRKTISRESTFILPEAKTNNKGLSKTLVSDSLEEKGDEIVGMSTVKESGEIIEVGFDQEIEILSTTKKLDNPITSVDKKLIKVKELTSTKKLVEQSSTLPKVKKSDRIKECLLIGLSIDDTIKKLAEEGLSTSKLWVEEIQKRIVSNLK